MNLNGYSPSSFKSSIRPSPFLLKKGLFGKPMKSAKPLSVEYIPSLFFDNPSAGADELYSFEELSGKFYDYDCTLTSNSTIIPRSTGSIAKFTTAKQSGRN
jgi:hypothetical protein